MKKTLLATAITMLMAESSLAQTHYFRAPILGVSGASLSGGSEPEEGGSESENNQMCQDYPLEGGGAEGGGSSLLLRFDLKDSLSQSEKQNAYDEEFEELVAMPVPLDYFNYGPEDFPLYLSYVEGGDFNLSDESELSSLGISNLGSLSNIEGPPSDSFTYKEVSSFTFCETENEDIDIGEGEGEGEGDSGLEVDAYIGNYNFVKAYACSFEIVLGEREDASYLEATFNKKDYTSTSPYTNNYTINLSQIGLPRLDIVGTNLPSSFHSHYSASYIFDSASRYDINLAFFNDEGVEIDNDSFENFIVPSPLGESELFYDEDNDYYLEVSHDGESITGFHPNSTAASYRYGDDRFPSVRVATSYLMEESTFVYDGSQTEINAVFPDISESLGISEDSGDTITMRKYQYSFFEDCVSLM